MGRVVESRNMDKSVSEGGGEDHSFVLDGTLNSDGSMDILTPLLDRASCSLISGSFTPVERAPVAFNGDSL
jgi:hypothetical protein